MTSSAERQRAFKNRMAEAGLVQVSVWVHAHQRADFTTAADRLIRDPDLQIGPMRNERTGRLERLNKR